MKAIIKHKHKNMVKYIWRLTVTAGAGHNNLPIRHQYQISRNANIDFPSSYEKVNNSLRKRFCSKQGDLEEMEQCFAIAMHINFDKAKGEYNIRTLLEKENGQESEKS